MEEEGKVSACSAAEDTSAKEEIWCLRRVGKTSDWLRLFEDTEVTLGRSLNVTYQLLSRSCPLMISRQHCVFKQNDDGQWTITDKKSLNGVWVNGERLTADRAWPLSAGDSVRLGFPVEGAPAEFEYVLVRDALQTVRPFLVPPRGGAEATATPRAKKSKRKLEEAEPETEPSRAKLFRCASEDRSLTEPCPLTQTQPVGEVPGPSVPATGPRGNLSPAHPRPHGDSDSPQPGTEQDRRSDDSLCREEVCLQVGRSLQAEEKLKKRLEEALQEQRKVMEELKCSRQGFEQILQAKDKELEVTKEEKEQARAQKDEVVIQMTDVLENELQCIICSELFIEAVTLSCAHSFCLHCIGAWRQRSGACPICRQDILSQTRSLVLDNCIDRMVESLSTELKERRQDLIAQRKGESAAGRRPSGCNQ
ncbi:E3 ubiquitin-protein ligase rnf8 isoform X3 [Anguilla anguilla]|uniref:E3 ubiquitin-protein ligase rnf8 isoform X3 n=1 Tax=Anguilla anguilla TaxID=7936 RepID=UPI0015ADDD8B|nr:E3 ubiquitin-protein ligase rnf8 isoform X3 [Anguilla anguilla]